MRQMFAFSSLSLVAFTAFAAVAPTAWGFGAPKHSSVEVEVQDGADGKRFALKVKPSSDMVVTLDAPWKLEVKGHTGLAIAKTSYGKGDLDEKLPGFVVAAKPESAKGDLEYSLTSFICTKDKTQCFREVHMGKHAWTK